MPKKRLLQNSWLYLVTDNALLKGRDIIVTLSRAIAAGVDIIQYRDKDASDREFLETGTEIKNLTERKKALFIVNDRVDLAIQLDSDGIHLGQEDMSVGEARRLLGKDKIIGISTHSIAQLYEAAKKDVDYISIGPIFGTSIKPDYNAIGLEPLRIAANEIKIPFVAIGGINESNLDTVVSAGAKRIAVVRAILSSEDTFLATKKLADKLR
ncbi:MAG: thiamine phosphate synthase [Candidatus Omnitrophica bacterium]|nr:thiamine phosphate synthase [Candidatus Omnitrophota bacterium]